MGAATLLLCLALASFTNAFERGKPTQADLDKHFKIHEIYLQKIIAAGITKNPIVTNSLKDGMENLNKTRVKRFTAADPETICSSKSNIYPHDGISDYGDTIDYEYIIGCSGVYRLPIDEWVNDVYVSAMSSAAVSPKVAIWTPKSEVVEPTTIIQSSSSQFLAYFKDLGAYRTLGTFTAFISAEIASDAVCSYLAMGPTTMVIDGGFITNKTDDFVQEIIPSAHEGVGRFPVADVSSYFAFRFPDIANFPSHPTDVIWYSLESYNQRFVTSYRYRCNAAAIAGPFLCKNPGDIYFVKVTGMDTQGNEFQRTHTFDCESSGPPPSTTSAPPPDTCFNGGILVNSLTECYCGPFYEGRQCEIKRCFNDGVLADNGQCLCRVGYTGTNCQDVVCPTKSDAQFDLTSRCLTFIIRSGTSMAAHMPKILEAARNITSFYSAHYPFYFQKFVLAVVSNGELPSVDEFDSSEDFINAIMGITHTTDLLCDDILLTALSAVLQRSTVEFYRQSPVFVFSDGLSNDDEDAQTRLYDQLTFWRGQIFFMLTDSLTGRCNIDVHAPGYRSLRVLAQFSHGLVVHPSLDELGAAAFRLAEKLYHVNYLLTNDLLDTCNRAPEFQNFFVDPSIQYFSVIATGNDLNLTLTRPDRVRFYPELTYHGSGQVGNVFIWTVDKDLQRGSYLIRVTSSTIDPCQYRVVGRGDYDLFLGISEKLTDDAEIHQPRYYNESHIVAHINNVVLPDDAQSLHAEALIWTNEGVYDKRTVLYASNGIYRDNCNFYLYFGPWTCRQPLQFFYINVFLTDSEGYTVQRTTTGFCSIIPPTPVPPEGCLNGGIGINGTCICPAHWIGSKCETINCLNLGTPMITFCSCIPGFTGQYCETPTCTQRNTLVDFSPNGRSLTFLIHDTISTRSAIRAIRDNAARLIQDISHHHKEWISNYQVIRFNDTANTREMSSPSADEFLQAINNIYNNNVMKSEISCRNISFFYTLYEGLSSYGTTSHGLVFVFINGWVGMTIDEISTLSYVYEALEKSHIRLSIVLLSGTPCGRSVSTPEVQILTSLTAFSGGEFIMVMPSNAGKVVHSIPTDYRSSYIYENFVSDCTGGQYFYFPVDSQLQSFTSYIIGDLDVDPVYYEPDGTKHDPYVLWNDIGLGSRMDQIIKQCDDGWDMNDNRCWKFAIIARDWYSARDDCHFSGSVLATIYNAGEQTFLDSQAVNVDYWTGLNDIANRGVFMWDQAVNESLSLEATGYKNWADGQPDTSNEQYRCVYDAHRGKPGWTTINCSAKFPYICVKHAYDVDFEPDYDTIDILPRGIWKAFVKTYEGACNIQIYGQSGIQFYEEYATNIHADSGSPQPYLAAEDNRILGHLTNQQTIGQNIQGHLQYAHMYTMNMTIVQAQRFQARDDQDCAYEYISTPFKCPSYTFQMLMTGVDRFGYLYQRIEPVTCMAGPTDASDCRNGAVFYNNKCVCPPRYEGDFCEAPICVHGITGPIGKMCRCENFWLGTTCEIPYCTREGNITDPNPTNKTLILLIDGVRSGDMVAIQNGIDTFLSTLLEYLSNNCQGWFRNYVAVVFRDSSAGSDSLSDIIESADRAEFISAIQAELSKDILSEKSSRSVISALAKALSSSTISPRSHAFVITAGNAEDYDQETVAFDKVAAKHTYISFFIVNDTALPGGVANYSDPSVATYFSLAYASGGGFYQGKTELDDFTYLVRDVAESLFYSYHISSVSRSNFTGLTEYLQIGSNTTLLILDIFCDSKPTVLIVDANGATVTHTTKGTTFTNTLIVVLSSRSEAGLWKVEVTPVVSGGFCYVDARGKSNLRINIAFTHDLRQDGGIFSDSAEYYPIAGVSTNAIVADTNGATLTFVQAFSSDERTLLWASPLIARERCTYGYVSANLFTCASPSVAIAVDGEDFAGIPIRRMIHVHCVGHIIPPEPGINTTSSSAVSTTTTPGLPVCDPEDTSVKADVVIVFDGSLGVPYDEYEEIVSAMRLVPDAVTIGQSYSRFMVGTYWDHAEFELSPEFTKINSRSDYETALNDYAKYGWSGDMGNNVQSIFDYVLAKANTFRSEALKMIIFFSSMGWDRSNTGQSFPDPTQSAEELRNMGINIIPIGYGSDANATQLEQIAPGCSKIARTKQEMDLILPWINTLFCKPHPLC